MHKTGPAAARLWQIDALRGLALLNMIVYHGLYDWVYVFGHPVAWYDIWSPHCHVWQQYICWSFLLLSGFSAVISRRLVRNGLLTAGCAAVLTAVTLLVIPEEKILFGVLHLLAAAMLLTALLRPVLDRIPPLAGAAGSALLFFLLNQFPYGQLGFENLCLAELPSAWYRCNWFVVGLPDLSVFSSSDYFPLVPWLFLFWTGYFLGRRFWPVLRRYMTAPPRPLAPLCAAGSRTLLIYMLHQPVLYGILWLCDRAAVLAG